VQTRQRVDSSWVWAGGLALASAAVTAYWLVGGTALLHTVGGYAEQIARTRSWQALALGALVVVVKLAGVLVAWGLGRSAEQAWWRRPLLLAGSFGSVVLTAYGGLLVVVGALVLTHALTPDGEVDRRVLTWHVLLWDLWFLVWGLALGRATWQRLRRPTTASSRGPRR